MQTEPTPEETVESLSAWFDSMRGEAGYGGPVSHWWRDSLRYCGVGLDWRYEGLIEGYLTLWRTTGSEAWLDRAARAGEDLCAGQFESGNFRASAFERNPESIGTPHEATASAALLRLARALTAAGRDGERYQTAAEANLEWHEDELWSPQDGSFSDTPDARSLVPNKIVSTAEAFCELARTTDEMDLVDARVIPALDAVLDLQVEEGPTRGAIHQLALPEGGPTDGDGKFFPIYIARCVPFLLEADQYISDGRFREAAVAAGQFLARVREPDGSFPAVVYEGGRLNRYPKWIAALGDVLRAFDALADAGFDVEAAPTVEWLFDGFDPCGAFRTASGFGHLYGADTTWSLCDVLHVVGWNDKAFRWVATRVDGTPVPKSASTVEQTSIRCRFGSVDGIYVEDGRSVQFTPDRSSGKHYAWTKGDRWGTIDE